MNLLEVNAEENDSCEPCYNYKQENEQVFIRIQLEDEIFPILKRLNKGLILMFFFNCLYYAIIFSN
jgi:hypothetical protein